MGTLCKIYFKEDQDFSISSWRQFMKNVSWLSERLCHLVINTFKMKMTLYYHYNQKMAAEDHSFAHFVISTP